MIGNAWDDAQEGGHVAQFYNCDQVSYLGNKGPFRSIGGAADDPEFVACTNVNYRPEDNEITYTR